MSDANDPPRQDQLDSHLAPLAPLLGKTWKGAFPSPSSEPPTLDIMRWERALNGKAVRVLHSVGDGIYGGETIFRWDEEKQAVVYHYFTTADFMTIGTARFEDGQMVTHEIVHGAGGGVTELRGKNRLLSDGKLRVWSEQRVGGEWQPGSEMIYEEEPEAEVIFQ